MNKKFLSVALFGALMVGSTGTFVSCKDYDDDIENLQGQINENAEAVATIQAMLNKGVVITDITPSGDGIKITTSDGKSYQLNNGKNGKDGINGTNGQDGQNGLDGKDGKDADVWKIGEDGYWYLNDAKTEYKAVGTNGKDGVNGQDGKDGQDGAPGKDGQDGKDGVDGQDGAPGKDGQDGAVGPQGPEGKPGQNGTNGKDGGYYIPNENGTFDFVADPAKPTEKTPTDIKWNLKAVSAVMDGNTVIFHGIQGLEDGFKLNLGAELKGLVFQPEVYNNGVEGSKYNYAKGQYLKVSKVKETFTDNSWRPISYEIPADAKGKWMENGLAAAAFTISPINTVEYRMNPENAKLKDIQWSFLYREPEYLSRAAEEATATPQFIAAEKNEEGILKVQYKINHPELLKSSHYWTDNKMSVMALKALLNKDEANVVASDYSAVVPVVQKLVGLAFVKTETEDITTNETCNKELYHTGKSAVLNYRSLTQQYNLGQLDLTKHLCLHFTENGASEHKNISYADAINKYGLKFTFDMMPYKIGNHSTMESQYGQVDEKGMFTPCYVDETGKSIPCGVGEDSTVGISSVGKEPVVRVTVMNGENVVLVGFVKIQIVKKAVANVPQELLVKDFGTLANACQFEKKMNWSEMSHDVYEQLGVSQNDFQNNYRYSWNETYEKNAKGEFDLVGSDALTNKFGGLFYKYDNTSTTTNEIIVWKTYIDDAYVAPDNLPATAENLEQVENIYKSEGHSKTLYIKFNGRRGAKDLYLGFTIKIGEKPVVSYGDRIQGYWFGNEVRMSVPRPTISGLPVTSYVKDLDDNFVGNWIKVAKTDAAVNNAYDWASMNIRYAYRFAKEQETFKKGDKTYKLTASADGTTLMCNGKNIATINTTEVPTVKPTAPTAEQLAAGSVKYLDTDEAKEFLNLFGHSEAAPNQQFAKVEVVSKYACGIELNSDVFNVRFLRPLDVVENSNGKFIDAAAEGSNVMLGSLFGVTDWRDQQVVKYNTTTKKYEGAMENGVDLFTYYFGAASNIKVDLANAECDLNGKQQKVTEVTSELKLNLLDAAGNVVTSNAVTLDINALNSYKINYKNNQGNVKNFNLWLPVEINYAWGTLKTLVKCPVESTMNN